MWTFHVIQYSDWLVWKGSNKVPALPYLHVFIHELFSEVALKHWMNITRMSHNCTMWHFITVPFMRFYVTVIYNTSQASSPDKHAHCHAREHFMLYRIRIDLSGRGYNKVPVLLSSTCKHELFSEVALKHWMNVTRMLHNHTMCRFITVPFMRW